LTSDRTRQRDRAALLRQGGVEARLVIPPDAFGGLIFKGIAESVQELLDLDRDQLGERLLACIDSGDLDGAKAPAATCGVVKFESVLRRAVLTSPESAERKPVRRASRIQKATDRERTSPATVKMRMR